MPVATLFDKGLAAYLDEERDRPGDLWFFLHIPKTAGSSFRQELADALKPNDNVVVDYKDTTRPLEEQRAALVERFIAAHAAEPRRFASGHLRWRHVERIREGCAPVKAVVMLRDPVKRLISDYRYQSTPTHPLHGTFRAKYPTILDYADDASSHDKMFSFLARTKSESPHDVIARVERTFSLVGLVETYPLSFRLMFRLLGEDQAPAVHTRKTSSTPENEIEIGNALNQKLRAANVRDLVIFQHFRQRFAAARESVWADLGVPARQPGSRAKHGGQAAGGGKR